MPTGHRPLAPVSLGGAKDLALRVIVPPNSTGTGLDVALTDTHGRRAALGHVRVDGLPGSGLTASYWAREVRVPLTAAARAGLDLKHVTSLELTPRSAKGKAWLMDAWGWRPGTPAVREAALPRVDIGRTTVKEGDSGVRTYQVPVRVSGRGTGQVRVYVVDPVTGEAKGHLLSVHPGGHDIDVPVRVKGNKRYSEDAETDVVVKAVRGAVIGSYVGGVTVLNDDPMPTVSVTPIADRVTEGQPLKWKVSLSEAADVDFGPTYLAVPVTAGPELSTKDVDPAWLNSSSDQSPDPERPLSQAAVYLSSDVPAGQLTGELTVLTVRDRVTEPAESVRLERLDDISEPQQVLNGTVLDAS